MIFIQCSHVCMGFMHLGLDGLNAAEKEAAMTQQSVVPCVLLCHIQTRHLFLVVSAVSLSLIHYKIWFLFQ